MQFSEIKKSAIAVATLVVSVTPWILRAMEVEPFKGTAAATFVSSVLGVLGIVAHYLVPNTTDDPLVAARSSVVLKTTARKAAKAKRASKDAATPASAAAAHPHPKAHKTDPGKPVL
jgi:hypothetical protein